MSFVKRHVWIIIGLLVVAAFLEWKTKFFTSHINSMFGTKFGLPKSVSSTGTTVTAPV